MRQNALWEPPCLCGCILEIWGYWAEPQNGHTYSHPAPFSITDIHIVKVCNEHKEWCKAMPDVSRHFEDKHHITGEPYQARGYLKHPIVNPTEAQCLYENLCIYNGKTIVLSCGCSGHECWDHKNKLIGMFNHPRDTRKCWAHKDDTVDMKQATIDHNKNKPG